MAAISCGCVKKEGGVVFLLLACGGRMAAERFAGINPEAEGDANLLRFAENVSDLSEYAARNRN